MYVSFDPNIIYIDMKVTFETVQVQLSRSHLLRRLQTLVFMYLQKFAANESPWK